MKRILFIDDNGQDLEIALRHLREQGLTMTLSTDNSEFQGETQQRSNQQNRDIIENAPVGIFRSTPDGKFISVNPATARILKYDSPEDLIETVNSRSIAEVLYLEPGRRHAVVEDLLTDKDWHAYEVQYRCKDGSVITCNDHIRKVQGPDGIVSELEGFVEDITDRKMAEDALRKSEERYRLIVETANEGIWQFDGEWKTVYVNQRLEQMLGCEPGSMLGLQIIDFMDDEGRGEAENLISRRENGIRETHDFRLVRRDGSGLDALVSASSLIDESGEFAGAIAMVTDITERKQVEAELQRSEEKFRVLTETSVTAIVLYQGERIVYANPATARMSGYTDQELLGMRFWDCIHPDFREAIRFRGLARQRGEQVPNQYECKMVLKGGEEKWAIVTAGGVEYKGEPACIVTMIDITETKRWEERISASLAEKEVLLKEIHHRVKNNLQIVSNLLELQTDYISDDTMVRILREIQDRIRTMALVHEKLYRTKNFSAIDFAEYIESLAKQLYRSYIMDPDQVSLSVDAGDITLGIDQAIPCGLIINELVSNSLKYAFPLGKKGEISISFKFEDQDSITLTVTDSGVGMPPGLDFRNTDSLGLQLVIMLTKQLQGSIELENEQGTTFTIKFRGIRLERKQAGSV